MLKVGDLRIGNAFLQKGSNFVEFATIQDLVAISEGRKIVEGVRLNDEWLLGLGCKHRLGLLFSFNGGANNIILNHVNGSYYPILTQEPEMSSEEGQMVSLMKIDFVHEFQNLIYALTKKELPCN